jgi:hypothetical protein
VGQRRLGGVLGEDGDAMIGSELTGPIEVEQQVRASIQRLADVEPIQFSLTVDEGESVRIGSGLLFRETWHRHVSSWIGVLRSHPTKQICELPFRNVSQGSAVLVVTSAERLPLCS